jgi:hypothetical protein
MLRKRPSFNFLDLPVPAPAQMFTTADFKALHEMTAKPSICPKKDRDFSMESKAKFDMIKKSAFERLPDEIIEQ